MQVFLVWFVLVFTFCVVLVALGERMAV